MFNKPIKKKKTTKDEEIDYWLSYSDLMASILIIFILLFTYKILDYNQTLEKKENKIKELTKLRQMVITKLVEEFGNEIQIDPKTGVIKLKSNILFDYDQSNLKPKGKEFLQKFVPRYLKVLLGDKQIKKNISRIVIEGHTDNQGSYLYNLELSQARAFNVVKYIYSDNVQSKYKDDLEDFVAAIGRSEMDLIKDKAGNVIKDKSRRVEFKFELKNEKILKEILHEVKK
ncbi:outer membrane protein/peptidoglycan-associated (lipo)protein [Halobacteroides halobius DSM 5150]|uniref:Outer membrane protein/peptidoglycan-associated (Lipo)protein n=1 Tax=Halobacteroides halobius (strain ATCC 35273 / DSM 5150 / MD-1) TaxID=748449 RepID=L0K7Q5_HALHC|nr:OmpA family protein [Halobacteroides halobius]AGB41056.1 outer membrane protein/peptidoglycan-associated (lipo)protein [Halobacteroides halobius DSM 5150]